MDSVKLNDFRFRLLDRRERLESARVTLPHEPDLSRLLHEVDAALQRISDGTFGRCATCHDAIEAERLEADPLEVFCVDHLGPREMKALQDDLALASQIQSTLLPERHLRALGWEACYHYEPAGVVSGDFCDLVKFDSGRSLFFLTGDVSGKGVASSLLMSHLHAIFRTLLSIETRVQQIVERANRLFCESIPASSYATLVCGQASASGEVEICNAGHCPPLLLQDGAQSIEPTGLPLGLFTSGRYSTRQLRLSPGEALVLYTDGLTEARDAAGDEYGPERLSGLVGKCSHLPPREITARVLDDWNGFCSGSAKNDDLTLVVVQRSMAAQLL